MFTRVKSKLTGERRERNSSLLWEQPKRFIIVFIIIIIIITIIINIIASLRAAKKVNYHHCHQCHYQIPPESASFVIQISIIIPTMWLFTGPALRQSWWQPERPASSSSYGHLRLHPVPSLREEVRSWWWFCIDLFLMILYASICFWSICIDLFLSCLPGAIMMMILYIFICFWLFCKFWSLSILFAQVCRGSRRPSHSQVQGHQEQQEALVLVFTKPWNLWTK